MRRLVSLVAGLGLVLSIAVGPVAAGGPPQPAPVKWFECPVIPMGGRR